MTDHPDWDQDGRDWPNRDASRFVHAGGLRWHVQRMGEGPEVLLIHGTGAATHSWRGLAPLLAQRFTVIAPDLPGHGFTQRPARLSLPSMAAGLTELLAVLGAKPVLAAGHSAGAAILVHMSLAGPIAPRHLVSLNGALLPLRNMPGQIFSPLAKLVASSSFVPRLFARHATVDSSVIERMLRQTGSSLDAEGADLYGRLARRSGHVGAAFGMMAQWDLRPLARDLHRLTVPLTLAVGTRDRTIRPAEATRVRSLLPSATIVRLPGLGHLAHEERPDQVADLVARL